MTKKTLFKNKSCIAVFSLTAILLMFPSKCFAYSLNGLQLWFDQMIPTLFPFMVLSGIMIQKDLTKAFVKALQPFLGRIFQVRPACIYGIVVGFLCGFPMGAHTAALLYEKKQITKQEAAFLLSFCNNIGPIYFLSFVLPTLHLSFSIPLLIGMYGLPFIYGIVMRYTCCKATLSEKNASQSDVITQKPVSFLQALDESVWRALGSIAKLGGYMIIFNLLFILPELISNLPLINRIPHIHILRAMLDCLLEITGGINQLKECAPFFVLCVLPFGGLSCFAQTYSMIRSTDLSLSEYFMHKMILTAATVFFYLGLVYVQFLL